MGSSARGRHTSYAPPDRPLDILLVEDNPGDARLTKEAFGEAEVRCDLDVVTGARSALDYLHRRGEYETADRPDLVLLDLDLPATNGVDVLDAIKSTAELRPIPVIVLTGSAATEDIRRSYQEHANAYLTKPVDPDRFADLARSVGEFWAMVAELPPSDA